jgi:hypothetical protein
MWRCPNCRVSNLSYRAICTGCGKRQPKNPNDCPTDRDVLLAIYVEAVYWRVQYMRTNPDIGFTNEIEQSLLAMKEVCPLNHDDQVKVRETVEKKLDGRFGRNT